MNPGQVWTIVGILVGAIAGITGGYIGWRSSRRARSRRFMVTVAVITLVLAVAAAMTVLRLDVLWPYRIGMTLAPAFLVYCFLRQIQAIRRDQR